MAILWGFDIGTNSIGWAIINDTDNSIIDTGVRIFPEGVIDTNTKQEKSKNAARREARQSRRMYYRRAMRKHMLLKNLRTLGFAPESDAELQIFFDKDPYQIRKRGLTEQLTRYELGRALYHLNQRRGFKSNRKVDAGDEENETGVVKSSIKAIAEEMQQEHATTLGELFANHKASGEKVRGKYTARKMYEDEFQMLWTAQQPFYPDELTEENRATIGEKIIFFQRPISRPKGKDGKPLPKKSIVGKCTFEPGKIRAPKYTLLFQEFRMWQDINKLTVYGGNRIHEDQQPLTEDETGIVARYLRTNPTLDLTKPKDYKKLCELLALPKLSRTESYQFNISQLHGNTTIVRLQHALGESLLTRFTQEQIEQMIHTLSFAEDPVKTAEYAQRKWNLSPEEAEKFIKVKLEEGYASVSTRAMKKIVPHLQTGHPYHEACKAAGYHHSLEDDIPVTGEMPRVNAKELRNPIVVVALNQLRLVANEMAQVYGLPDSIRVEMGRELRLPKSKRVEIEFRNRKLDKERKEIEEILLKDPHLRMQNPSRNDIIKYRLWQETGGVCIYTGTVIPLHRLYDNDVDIEHILPYSRTLDDSQANKTICLREPNIAKGDQTPYEWLHGSDKYEELLERVKSSPMPRNKKNKFSMTPKTFGELNKDFIARQLNDTRYISSQARDYLRCLCKDVSVGNGSITSWLRWQWGLNTILNPEGDNEKNRADHRHHAIDAICIAFTSRSMYQKMSTLNTLDQMIKNTRVKYEYPWETFRVDVHTAIDRILVSHKVNKRVRGQMHDPNYFGRKYIRGTEIPMVNERGTPRFTKRIAVPSLSINQIQNIVDDGVQKVIINHLHTRGIDIKNPASIKKSAYDNALKEDIYLPSKKGNPPPIKSVRVFFDENSLKQLKGYNVWVKTNGNHHCILYEKPDGSRDADIITYFDAYKKIKEQVNVHINRNSDKGNFICSLVINEMWLLDYHPDEIDLSDTKIRNIIANKLCRVKGMSLLPGEQKRIVATSHTVALDDRASGEKNEIRRTPNTLTGFKVSISPIGRLSVATE
ncbi:MAG: type II CRISPR RNA-guided endonuclease Cas9 [Candidatus Kapaibacterium sp.]